MSRTPAVQNEVESRCQQPPLATARPASSRARRWGAALSALALVLTALTAASPARAQADAVERSQMHFQRGSEAYQNEDYATWLAELQATAELRPNHPTLVYNLACANARNGNADRALHWLSVYADMGLIADPGDDEDLDSIEDDPRFRKILETIEKNRQPVSHSEVAFSIDEPDLIPESIAFDAQSKTFFVGGIRGRKIYKCGLEGQCETVLDRENLGLWSVFGMAVDAEDRHFWITTAAIDQTPDVDSLLVGFSSVVKMHLDTGHFMQRWDVPNRVRPHILNDLCLTPDGDLFITDNQSGEIYKITGGKGEMEPWITSGRFVSPQGITYDTARNRLLIADYSTGLHAIDLETTESHRIDPGERQTFLGIDGLAYHDGALLAIQNGVSPPRVLRIRLDDAGLAATSVEVLEVHHPAFDEPTLGVVADGSFYYVANSQWGQLEIGGSIREPDDLANPTILRIPL